MVIDAELILDKSLNIRENRHAISNITDLSSQEATELLRALKPVKFTKNSDPELKTKLGFLSEDVPSAVALADQSAWDAGAMIALLTKNSKDQSAQISLLLAAIRDQNIQIQTLLEKVRALEAQGQ